MADNEITSENIVGYDTETMVKGNNYFCPMFLSADGSPVNLQDIQLGASTPNAQYSLQVLNSGKGNAEFYYWYKKNAKNEIGPSGNKVVIDASKNGGWFQAGLNEKGLPTSDRTWAPNKTFGFGEGVQINCVNAGFNVTYAGSVSDQSKTFTCVKGNNYYGNPYAAAIKLQDIQFSSSTPNAQYSLQVLNSGKGNAEFYYWYKKNAKNEIGPSGNKVVIDASKNGGWFQAGLNEKGLPTSDRTYVPNKEFASGAGFQINCVNAGFQITIKSPYSLKAL